MKTKNDIVKTVRWESELIPILSNAGQQIGGGKKTAVEVPSGYGIADLVFYDLNQDVITERVQNQLNPIEQANLLRVLVELQDYATDETINLTVMRKNNPYLKGELVTYLVDNNFLVPDDPEKGLFKKGADYKNGLQEVVAIEAKLKDWKRGLYQAYRYRSYADKSYLAVYAKSINAPLKHIEEFKKFNVGLIEVAETYVKVHYRPKKEKKLNGFMKAVAYESILASEKDLFPDWQEVSSLVGV